MPNDTYIFATTSGDRAFINWLVERLIHVYKENENVDFVLTLKEFAKAGEIIEEMKNDIRRELYKHPIWTA